MSFSDDAAMEISTLSTEPGGLIIELSNTGETFIRGIHLLINVSGGWINPIDFHYDNLLFACNCTDVFEPGDTYTIHTAANETFFSLGFLEVSIVVDAPSIEKISLNTQAFILGPFIFFT